MWRHKPLSSLGERSLPMAEMRSAVVVQAMQWLGTPYHHGARLKGVGVDCAMLLAEVFEACGLVQRLEPGSYAHDWHLHRSEEVFLRWVQEVAGATPTDDPQPGDVALFRYGRTWSHGAIVVEPAPGLQMVHAYIDRGVILTRPREEPLSGRPARFFTLFGA